MYENFILLTLTADWFDLIKDLKKDEEYRSNTGYWRKRLIENKNIQFVIFRNGYNQNSRTLLVKIDKIYIGVGKPEIGAPKEECIILKIGGVIWFNPSPDETYSQLCEFWSDLTSEEIDNRIETYQLQRELESIRARENYKYKHAHEMQVIEQLEGLEAGYY